MYPKPLLLRALPFSVYLWHIKRLASQWLGRISASKLRSLIAGGNSLRGRFNLLSNEAAKHKIAIRPRKNHPRNTGKCSDQSSVITQESPPLINNTGKKPPRKTITSKEGIKDHRTKIENGKNFGFFSRLLKSKQKTSKEPEEKWHVTKESPMCELASMNVRTIKLQPGESRATSHHCHCRPSCSC